MVGGAVIENDAAPITIKPEGLSDKAFSESRVINEFALGSADRIVDGIFALPEPDKAGGSRDA
jgi:hypothetical protein